MSPSHVYLWWVSNNIQVSSQQPFQTDLYVSPDVFFQSKPTYLGPTWAGLWAYYNELVQSLSMNPHSALHPLFQSALFYVISSSMQSFMPQIWASVFEEENHFPYQAHKKKKSMFLTLKRSLSSLLSFGAERPSVFGPQLPADPLAVPGLWQESSSIRTFHLTPSFSEILLCFLQLLFSFWWGEHLKTCLIYRSYRRMCERRLFSKHSIVHESGSWHTAVAERSHSAGPRHPPLPVRWQLFWR